MASWIAPTSAPPAMPNSAPATKNSVELASCTDREIPLSTAGLYGGARNDQLEYELPVVGMFPEVHVHFLACGVDKASVVGTFWGVSPTTPGLKRSTLKPALLSVWG